MQKQPFVGHGKDLLEIWGLAKLLERRWEKDKKLLEAWEILGGIQLSMTDDQSSISGVSRAELAQRTCYHWLMAGDWRQHNIHIAPGGMQGSWSLTSIDLQSLILHTCHDPASSDQTWGASLNHPSGAHNQGGQTVSGQVFSQLCNVSWRLNVHLYLWSENLKCLKSIFSLSSAQSVS